MPRALWNPNSKKSLLEYLMDLRQQVMYLPPVDSDVFRHAWEEGANISIDEQFQTTVSQLVIAYVEKGKMPPEQIAPTIMNLADDLLSGRDLAIRVGDYIALRNYMHGASKPKSS